MPLFEDAKKAALNDAMAQMAEDQENFPEEQEEEGGFFELPKMPDLTFLKAKTGSGSVEDYMQHPLNFKNSQGAAQMIRGFTGMLGDLDLALVDITLGAFELAKEKRNVVQE